MLAQLNQEEENQLVDSVTEKVRGLRNADALEKIATMTLELILRRAEDQSMKEDLLRSLEKNIEAARQPSVSGASLIEAAAINCAEILRTARESRQSRIGRQAEPADETNPVAIAETAPAETPRWLIRGLAGLLVSATAAGVVAIVSYQSWHNLTAPAARLTAARLVSQMLAAPAPADGASVDARNRVRLRVMRGADDRKVVIAESVPRRICPKTAWLLGKMGKLTINGQVAARTTKPAVTALCYRNSGETSFVWSPQI